MIILIKHPLLNVRLFSINGEHDRRWSYDHVLSYQKSHHHLCCTCVIALVSHAVFTYQAVLFLSLVSLWLGNGLSWSSLTSNNNFLVVYISCGPCLGQFMCECCCGSSLQIMTTSDALCLWLCDMSGKKTSSEPTNLTTH